ncbi:MAG: extracellular solute-binding protein [Candidatus Latescibacterota bacterium]
MNRWLALWLGLAACGGKQEAVRSVDLETLDPAGQKVTFWYQHTLSRETALQEMIRQFNADNPWGVQVLGEYAGQYSDIYNKMLVGLQTDVLPNLVVAYANQAIAYYENGGAVDLQPYLDSPRWGLGPQARQDLYAAFVLQDRYQGAQVAFPPNRAMELLYYNADWLQELGWAEPPADWETFARACRAAQQQPFSRARVGQPHLGFLLDVDASRLASMVFSRGGDLMRDGQYTLSTSEVRAALELLRQLVQEGSVALVGEPNEDANEFSVGQVLFFTDSSSGLPYVEAGVQSGLGFRWEVAPLPHTTPEPVVNVYGASVAVCRASPAAQLAAWLFLRWFTEPPQQARWVEASGYFPVRGSARALLSSYFARNPHYARAYEWLAFGRSEPTVMDYEQVRRLIARAVVDVLEGEDMDRTLAALERDANATLRGS